MQYRVKLTNVIADSPHLVSKKKKKKINISCFFCVPSTLLLLDIVFLVSISLPPGGKKKKIVFICIDLT